MKQVRGTSVAEIVGVASFIVGCLYLIVNT
jgi:hypothetical protein